MEAENKTNVRADKRAQNSKQFHRATVHVIGIINHFLIICALDIVSMTPFKESSMHYTVNDKGRTFITGFIGLMVNQINK